MYAHLRRARPVLGLTLAIVPFAILVHLVAEALALGTTSIDAAFVTRHVYLGVIMIVTFAWYARTAGLGMPLHERVRRSALARATARRWGARGLGTMIAANVAIFALGQLVEGTPIASGSLTLGIVAGLVGSLLSALGVVAVARPLARAIAHAIGSRLSHAVLRTPDDLRFITVFVTAVRVTVARCLPNRAPPVPFPA